MWCGNCVCYSYDLGWTLSQVNYHVFDIYSRNICVDAVGLDINLETRTGIRLDKWTCNWVKLLNIRCWCYIIVSDIAFLSNNYSKNCRAVTEGNPIRSWNRSMSQSVTLSISKRPVALNILSNSEWSCSNSTLIKRVSKTTGFRWGD